MTGNRDNAERSKHPGQAKGNLGQKEAGLEKASEEQLSHMEERPGS